MISLKKISLTLLLSLVITACGIYSFKGSIPDHLNDLKLITFKNLTTEFAVETDLEAALTDRMLNERLLPLSAKESPDSHIEGKINSVADKPNSFDENENVLEYRLEIRGEVIWYDHIREKEIFKKNYSVFSIYYSEDINATRSDEEQITRDDAYEDTIQKLVDFIVESMTEEW